MRYNGSNGRSLLASIGERRTGPVFPKWMGEIYGCFYWSNKCDRRHRFGCGALMSGARVTKPDHIRLLNDAMRAAGPSSSATARWVMTSGIQRLGAAVVAAVIEKVRTFDAFSQANDPHGEHDMGSIEIAQQKVYWKIDYYNIALDAGSPDPSDERLTCRVLTIMCADEY
jgi:hypothetical protein